MDDNFGYEFSCPACYSIIDIKTERELNAIDKKVRKRILRWAKFWSPPKKPQFTQAEETLIYSCIAYIMAGEADGTPLEKTRAYNMAKRILNKLEKRG